MRDPEELFSVLSRSQFRSRFRLDAKDAAYLNRMGLETILRHGREFLEERLAPAQPKNDGRQTPMRGHPIFVAQHATGVCCRSCLAEWHSIPSGRPLVPEEIDYLLGVLRHWLETHAKPQTGTAAAQQQLFGTFDDRR